MDNRIDGNKDFVSIVIPCFNRPEYIESVLNSIESHADYPYELIIHDDNSIDGATDELLKYKDRISTLLLNTSGHQVGLAESVNRCVEIASSEYIVFINSDCIFNTSFLKNVVNVLQKQYVGWIGLTDFVDNIEEYIVSEGTKFTFMSGIGSGCAFAFTKSVWSNIGGFDSDARSGCADCYDDQTEVLTKDGFKYFEDLTYDDKVATIDPNKLPKDQVINYVNPQYITKKHYKGKMHEWRGKYIDLKVTPSHDLLISSTGGFSFKKIKSQHVNYKSDLVFNCSLPSWNLKYDKSDVEVFTLPSCSHNYHNKGEIKKEFDIPRKNIPIYTWLKFFGLWLGDGWTTGRYTVGITCKKDNIKPIVEKVFNNLGFKWHENNGDYIIRNKQLNSYLSQFGKCDKKFIPDFIKNLDRRYLMVLSTYMNYADGCINRNCYYSTSERLIKDFVEIQLKIGRKCFYSVKRQSNNSYIKGRRIISKKTLYQAYFNKRWYHNLKQNKPIESDYDGMVYCCTIPTGLLFVRRNGKSCWSGNSPFQYRSWYHGYFRAVMEGNKPFILNLSHMQQENRDSTMGKTGRDCSMPKIFNTTSYDKWCQERWDQVESRFRNLENNYENKGNTTTDMHYWHDYSSRIIPDNGKISTINFGILNDKLDNNLDLRVRNSVGKWEHNILKDFKASIK